MKVSIFGAGRVGVSVAFSLLHRGLADEIILVDVDRARAEGEALDLLHASPMFKRCDVRSGEPSDLHGSDFVIVTAGRSQRPGETRLDLIEGNALVMKEVAQHVSRFAKDAIVINVTNPVDVLSYLLWRLTGFESSRVLGSGTTLDTARLRVLLSKTCRISPQSIHAYVIGEHGDSEFVPFSVATIGGMKLLDYCGFCSNSEDGRMCADLSSIVEEVRRAAYKIIEKKGATNLAIGAVVGALVETIVKDEKRVWTPSVLVEDVYIGYPAVVGRSGVERTLRLNLTEEEEKAFRKSMEVIRAAIRLVGERIGIGV